MTIEVSTLPGGTGLVLSIAAYVGLSLLVGQEIGARMIDKSGWYVTCPKDIETAARPVRPPRQVIPTKRCSDMAGHLGPFAFDALRLCNEFNDPVVNGAAIMAEREARDQLNRLDEARVEQAAKFAGSQCACAAQVYRSDKLVALAVEVGTARLISLPGVDDMETGLRQALGTPQCQAISGGAS